MPIGEVKRALLLAGQVGRAVFIGGVVWEPPFPPPFPDPPWPPFPEPVGICVYVTVWPPLSVVVTTVTPLWPGLPPMM